MPQTGLIAASVELPAALAGWSEAEHEGLMAFAQDIGLAYQIVDDLLDLEGDEADMGKRVGKDAEAGKANFVTLLGADAARQRLNIIAQQVKVHLAPFGPAADFLRDTADFVISRRA